MMGPRSAHPPNWHRKAYSEAAQGSPLFVERSAEKFEAELQSLTLRFRSIALLLQWSSKTRTGALVLLTIKSKESPITLMFPKCFVWKVMGSG